MFKKINYEQNQYIRVRFLMMDPPAKPAKTQRGHDMTKSLIEPRAEVHQPVPKLSNEALSKIILFYIRGGVN